MENFKCEIVIELIAYHTQIKLLYKWNWPPNLNNVTERAVIFSNFRRRREKMNNPRVLLLALLFAVTAQINGLYTHTLWHINNFSVYLEWFNVQQNVIHLIRPNLPNCGEDRHQRTPAYSRWRLWIFKSGKHTCRRRWSSEERCLALGSLVGHKSWLEHFI